ncbi:MAG: hypothetical protein IKZ60_08820 [Bacteroidales bacterium]|nr:hypothetical protein [Bacteroidales bacterium]MBR5925554.1 hypothetical protein [Bacteroidales bacterium]
MKKLFKKIKAWHKKYCQRPDDWEKMSEHDRKLFLVSACAAFCMVMCPILLILVILLLCAQSCSTPSKLETVQREKLHAEIGLVQEPVLHKEEVHEIARPDTLIIHDDDGRELILMKAVKDENGEMVATDVINAAVVEARFRNVAERHGKVDIEFQIRVPKDMQDEAWQLRFYPRMHILGDTLNLEQVIITGAKYRKAQLRGYQQYEKYLASIVTDSTRFINMRLLELFIQRNIPDLYAFKADSTEVADESFNAILDTKVASSFASQYGVTGRDAIEHYTNTISKRLNARRWEQREKMYRRYVKAPIVHEGLRLDTVITAANGDFIYNYVQTIHTRPKLRKVDVVLSGDIYEQDKRLYEIPETEPLTYYISSLSAFVDGTTRYKKQIISRRVEANTACYIDFEQGSAEIIEDMSNNRSEMGRIKGNLGSLIENREFDLDSIVVTASCSPEGSVPFNTRLSQRRSESVSRYFSQFIQAYRDSLREENMIHVYFDGMKEEDIPGQSETDVRFISRSNPENWQMLDVLVEQSEVLTENEKLIYKDIREVEDPDLREQSLSWQDFYPHLREVLYPRLRTVKFDFHLHRKGMVKDTVQTTVIDEEYMAGVQAIRDRDYETAIQILRPYQDYNAAVAFCAMDYNASALQILEELPETDQVNYLLAVIYSRQGKDKEAVERYLKACRQTPSYWHRGNLDPEISALIKRYNLNNNSFQTH